MLNSGRSAIALNGFPFEPHELEKFDLIALKLIQRLCEKGNLSICLSSSWRILWDIHDIANHLNLPIMDKTPVFRSGIRGEEIAQWLYEHPEVVEYAIVDDDADMLEEQMARFVKTNGDDGLSFRNYLDLCNILGVEP